MKKRENKSFRYVEYFYKIKQEIQVQVFLYLIETNRLDISLEFYTLL